VYNISDDPVKRSVFVEKMSFVQHCIKFGQFKHRPPILTRMGGQVRRSWVPLFNQFLSLRLSFAHKYIARRVPFTQEDDEHLARYIARKLPDVDAGGRKGDAIYLWLYEVVNIHPVGYDSPYISTE